MTAGRLMAAEMAEQPSALASLVARRPELVDRVRSTLPERLVGVVLVARGSSDNAAVYGRYLLEAATGRPVALAAPSLHTLYRVEVDYSGYGAIAVSQSGRTPEIATVMERLGAAGARTVAVTNDLDSPLAQAADAALELGVGEERAVPATKTFTAQLAAFAVLAEALGEVPWSAGDLDGIPAAVEGILSSADAAHAAAAQIGDSAGLIVLARGYLYCVALETALKLKETTGILAEGYSTADFRHGPIVVARGELPTLAFAVRGPAAADVDQLTAELRGRGGQVFAVGDSLGSDLPLPAGLPEALAPIPATVRGQQLAWALALERGLDPDAPAGLRKVTPTT